MNSSAPVCRRCKITPRLANRLTLECDDERGRIVYADLCRACTKDLEGWLNPPAEVVKARKIEREQEGQP